MLGYKIIFEHTATFWGSILLDRQTDKLDLKAHKLDGLYLIPHSMISKKAFHGPSVNERLTEWHRKLGHVSTEQILITIDKVDSVPHMANIDTEKAQCTACL